MWTIEQFEPLFLVGRIRRMQFARPISNFIG